MRAIVVREFGDPAVMRLEAVPDPQPGPGQIVVRVRAAGVNPVDTYIRSGGYAALPPLPYTPGVDGAGEVEAVGPDVQGVAVGDRVYISAPGAYAERAAVPARAAWPLPDGVSFEAGAAIGVPYGTAYAALFLVGQAQPGDWVLVHGASGGVGVAAVQLAVRRGLRVVGTAGTEAGLGLVREMGAGAFSHDDADGLLAATGGRGYGVIVEMAAHLSLGMDLPLLAPGGRVVVVGSRGPATINARDLMARGASITGVMGGQARPEEVAAMHQDLAAGLADGSLHPVIGRRLPLAEAPEAHDAVLRPGAYGKILLIP